MGLFRQAVIAALFLAVVHLSSARCWAVGHFDSDRYYGNPYPGFPGYDRRAGEIAPSNLLAPQDIPMSNKGVFISPRWILGIYHASANVDPATSPPIPVTVLVPKKLLAPSGAPQSGYYEYVFSGAVDAVNLGPYTGDPLRLMKLANIGTLSSGESDPYAPSQVNLDTLGHRFFRLGDFPVAQTQVTLGGFGVTAWESGGTIACCGITGSEGLRWGRQRADSDGTFGFGGSQSSPGYIPYAAGAYSGDSGSGVYRRRGLDWETVVSVQNGGVSPSGKVIESYVSDIYATLGTRDPGALSAINAQALAALPTATRYWDGALNQSWNTSGVWADAEGNYVAAPAYNQTVGDVVSINNSHGPLIDGAAVASDLLISASNPVVTMSSSGSLTVNGLFLATSATHKGTFTMNGGSLSTEQTYVGLRGVGTFNQGGGVHETDLLTVGGTGGTASLPSILSFYGGTLRARETVVGDRAGGHGFLSVSAGAFETTKLSIGLGGEGDFSQGGGTAVAQEVEVAAGSRLSLFGGQFIAKTVALRGTLEAQGGAISAATLSSATGSHVDFDGSPTSVTFGTGMVDLTAASFTHYVGGSSIRVNNALVTVSASSMSLLNNGILLRDNTGATVTDLSLVPIHAAGTTAVIRNGYTVIGTGAINDRVEVSEGASLIGGANVASATPNFSANGYLTLNNGLKLNNTSTANLGTQNASIVNVVEGRSTVANASVISTGTTSPSGPQGSFTAKNVFVASGGKLVASGERFFVPSSVGGILNNGQFEIGTSTTGDEIAPLRIATTIPGGRGYLDSYGTGSVMAFNLSSTASDVVYAARLNLAGPPDPDAEVFAPTTLPLSQQSAIQIDMPISEISSLEYGNVFELVNLDVNNDGQLTMSSSQLREALFGHFARVRFGGATDPSGLLEPAQSGLAAWADFANPDGNSATADGMAIAIVYADQFATGGFLENAHVDPSLGVSAVVALPGDLNLDEVVNQLDVSRLSSNYNGPGTWAEGDINGDGIVNINDFSILSGNYNRTADYDGGGISGIPEPATGFLLAIAMLSGFVTRRPCGERRCEVRA